jgi:hypothetical protein
VIFRIECTHAHSWGCGSFDDSDGVVDVDLTLHADYVLDAMARLVNSLITTELRLYRSTARRAPKSVRDGWLRRALGAVLDRMVPGSAVYEMTEAAGTLPALKVSIAGADTEFACRNFVFRRGCFAGFFPRRITISRPQRCPRPKRNR